MNPKAYKEHDGFFKLCLSNSKMAKDFFALYPPQPLQQRYDLNTLTIEQGSFVDPAMEQLHSDILYRIQTKADEDKSPAYLYCLVEHQSRPQEHMAFRLLNYCLKVMHSRLEQGDKKLPIVVPILFYHGKTSPYPYSMNWLDEFEDRELAEHAYGHPFKLVDVTVLPDKAILTHKSIAAMEMVQKHIWDRDLAQSLQPITLAMRMAELTVEQVRSLVTYTVG